MHKGQTKDIRTTIKQFAKKMKNLPAVEHSAVEKEKKKTEIKDSEIKDSSILAQKDESNQLAFKNEKEYAKFLTTFKKEHKVFADNYLSNLNLTESYKIAYPLCKQMSISNSAARLISNVRIQRYISYIYTLRQKKLEISENKLLSNLNDLYNRAMQAVPVLDKHGKETGMYNFNGMAAAKAAELIAKITGIGLINKRINSDNLVIVKTYVVPQFQNTINLPEQSVESIKQLIESYGKHE
jgi:phage terminase small subunit